MEEDAMELKKLDSGGFAFYVNEELIAAGAAGTVATGASRHLRTVMKDWGKEAE